jgi:hypothetical protein
LPSTLTSQVCSVLIVTKLCVESNYSFSTYHHPIKTEEKDRTWSPCFSGTYRGGWRVGNWLGSDWPLPAGLIKASFSDRISRVIFTLP